MYKLLIVDDERLVLRSLSHIVKRHCPEISVVGTIQSGAEAVAVALDKKPDIIFMDIKLDGVNGLDAVEEIKKVLPQSVIIVISAYDEFQYARKSIELGVMDYLLKPVTKEKIIKILKKAVARVEEQKKIIQEQWRLKEKITKMRPYLEKKFFFSLLYPSIEEHSLDEYQQLLELDFALGQAAAVYLEQVNDLTESGGYEQIFQTALHLLEAKVILFSSLFGRMFWLLIGYEKKPQNTRIIWENALVFFQENLGLAGSSVVLGDIFPGFKGMIASFHELRKTVSLYSYPPGVHFARETPETEGNKNLQNIWETEQKFFSAVKTGQKETAGLFFTELFRVVTETSGTGIQAQKDYFHGTIAVLLRILYEKLPGKSRRYLDEQTFKNRLNQAAGSSELRLVMEDLVYVVIQNIEKETAKENISEIDMAVRFIEENYHRELSLADIASVATVCHGHLNKLFKEHQGQTVMDFLEKTRIKNAVRLLLETGLSVKEIAARVGYKDPNYFSKVFRKVTNSTPTSLRKKKSFMS